MTLMFDLSISLDDCTTQVAVKLDGLKETGLLLREVLRPKNAVSVLVVSDERVGALYGPTVFESLAAAGLRPHEFRFKQGEASKNLRVAEDIYRALVDCEIGRDGLVLALGGGVVSDLAGFAAATWMRGVRFAICPTTLEADIDASIGGKTAVNIPGGKNLVGVFHQPVLVAIDPSCLKTLEPRDVRAGMAESIKHALITSGELLTWQEQKVEAILSLDEEVVTDLILRNVRIKAAIVQQDAREQTGERMLLNLGHTIGHAIESCSDFALRHGECVALGTLAACRLSRALGMLDQSIVGRLERLFARFGLPTELAVPIDTDEIMATLRQDKKVRGGEVQFVLLEDIGRPIVKRDCPQEFVREAYESLLP